MAKSETEKLNELQILAKRTLMQNALSMFLDNCKNRAVTGMWMTHVYPKLDSDEKLKQMFITSLRKFTFKLFQGEEKTIEYNGATVSIAPDIKILNKISIDFAETNNGDIRKAFYNYIKVVLPTIDSIFSYDTYCTFDMFSSFYNAWVNMFDRIEVYNFLDPHLKYRGPYWKYTFDDLKLDGSSGILSDENNLDYRDAPVIPNVDLNLYFSKMTLDHVDANQRITKIFAHDVKEQINKMNSFG